MQTFTNSDGLRLAYKDTGTGPAILCLPGLTRTHHDFDEMSAHLGGVRLIRPDYRGRGASAYDADFTNYTAQVEARDVVELMDHLGLEKAAMIGTSRGGIIAMVLAATAKPRLSGVLLNDIGPVITPGGLTRIFGYLGQKPSFKTLAEAADKLPGLSPGFVNVPKSRWQTEAARMYVQTAGGLDNRYDPKLRDAVLANYKIPPDDIWPFFDALAGLPLALLRGENSDLLSRETAAAMQARHPDMLFAQVPDRAHTPLLDEPESLSVINDFIGRLA